MNEVNNDTTKLDNIAKFVQDLPELYQPVYGCPEFTSAVSRACKDRLVELTKIYDATKKILRRDLKVLDLGCAQGFFSLSLAKQGATVHGVDFLDKNIALCKVLAKTNPDLSVTFEIAKIEDIIINITKNQYDIVLGLSVFHHLIHANGIDFVKDIIRKLAENINIGVFELALKQEPLYWGPSQPDDPESLLEPYAFVHEVTKFPTHLSGIQRPFIFASNTMWWLNDTLGMFDHFMQESHRYAHNVHQGSRKYYFNSDNIIKIYKINIPDKNLRQANITEFNNEINYLNSDISDCVKPKLLLYGHNDTQEWLVRHLIKGCILTEIFDTYSLIDIDNIVVDILKQLIILERYSYYHNDVRCWNVLIQPNKHAVLIDFGAISCIKKDCTWPWNVYLAFLIFIRELFSRKTECPDPIRPPLLNIGELPQPYRNAFNKFFSEPEDKWSFAYLKECIESSETAQEAKLNTNTAFYKFFSYYEDAAKQYKNALQYNQNMFQQAEARAISAETKFQAAELRTKATETRIHQLTTDLHDSEARVQQLTICLHDSEARVQQLTTQAQEVSAALNIVLSSHSWRIMAPYRAVGDFIKELKNGSKQLLKPAAAKVVGYVSRHPAFKARTIAVLDRFPKIKSRLKVFYYGYYISKQNNIDKTQRTLPMSQRAEKIYKELKEAIAQNQAVK